MEEMNQEKVENRVENQEVDDTAVTRQLIYDAVVQLGCQPKLTEDGGLIFEYSDENFCVDCGGYCARFWDPSIATFRVGDPNLADIREAANAANFGFGPTMIFTNPTDADEIFMHSRYDIMVHPNYPNHQDLVRQILDSFFAIKQRMLTHLEQIRNAREEARRNRPRVGFDTSAA